MQNVGELPASPTRTQPRPYQPNNCQQGNDNRILNRNLRRIQFCPDTAILFGVTVRVITFDARNDEVRAERDNGHINEAPPQHGLINDRFTTGRFSRIRKHAGEFLSVFATVDLAIRYVVKRERLRIPAVDQTSDNVVADW